MDINVFYGILIPFLGTSAGAACVFFMKKNLNEPDSESTYRLCSRSYGCGFHMESAAPGN